MKILLLNPFVDAKHQIVQALREKGFGVILVSHPAEAMEALRLHGRTIEVAILHREPREGGVGEPGLDFIRRFRSDPDQSDLPYIITSSEWSETDFVSHQATSHGAHAYLKFPFDGAAAIETLEKMFGSDLYRAAGAPSLKKADVPSESVPALPDFGELVLEEMTVGATSGAAPSGGGILLEMPVSPEDEAAQAASEAAAAQAAEEASSAAEAKEGTVAKKKKSTKKKDTALTEADRLLKALKKSGAEAAAAEESAKSPKADDELDRLLGGTRAGGSDSSGDPDGLFNKQSVFKNLLGESSLEKEEKAAVAETAAQDHEQRLRSEIEREILAREMPYLFGAGSQTQFTSALPRNAYDPVIPLGDAVVPGGAANAPDEETLRKFLELREQDVAALSAQLKTAREQVIKLEDAHASDRMQFEEFKRKYEAQEARIQEFEKEKELALEAVRAEIEEIRFQNRAKADRVRVLEHRVKDATSEAERLKERVRMDIRKIRIREKELENRLEIMRRDSEALIAARENKIIELKRKLDLIEFNMDLLQDQYVREKENSQKLRERFSRALQAVRVAGGLLDNAPLAIEPEETEADTDPLEAFEDEVASDSPLEISADEAEDTSNEVESA